MKTNFLILALQQGQWKSVRKCMSVDINGAPIPWYTYPAIEYLNSFDFKTCNIFEFGSGNSSLYWANRAQSVISVEDNLEWFNIIKTKKKNNQEISYTNNRTKYTNTLKEQGKLFEIIVIDGNWRKECTIEAISYLKDDGLIILDNSDRTVEMECNNLLRKAGFLQIDFNGFGPINNYCWTTSLFIKNTCFLRKIYTNPKPIGGLGN